jgi:hypothetical protein
MSGIASKLLFSYIGYVRKPKYAKKSKKNNSKNNSKKTKRKRGFFFKRQSAGTEIPRLPIESMGLKPEIFDGQSILGIPPSNKSNSTSNIKSRGLLDNSLEKIKIKEEKKKSRKKSEKAYYLNKRQIIKDFKVSDKKLKNSSKEYYLNSKVKKIKKTLKKKKYKVSINRKKNKKKSYQSLQDKLK